jgi:hypothetical protein
MGNNVTPIMHPKSKEPNYSTLSVGALERKTLCNIQKLQLLQFTMLQYILIISMLVFTNLNVLNSNTSSY